MYFKYLKYCFLIILLWSFVEISNAQLRESNIQNGSKNTVSRNADAFEKLKTNILIIDKLKHFTLSLYLTTTTYYVLSNIADINKDKALISGASISLSFGIGKETVDSFDLDKSWDFYDFVADIGGIIAGSLLMDGIDR